MIMHLRKLKVNEFTKEELYILLKCVRLVEIDHSECTELDNAKYKIQLLVDNYDDQPPQYCGISGVKL